VSIKAEAALDKLAPSDIAYFVPDWPIKRDLAGSLAVNGLLNDLNETYNSAAGAGVRIMLMLLPLSRTIGRTRL
jgi:hypothetical protein